MKKPATILAILWITTGIAFSIDNPKFKVGFGGGINFSKLADKNSYPLLDNGVSYTSEYSKMFSNLGSEYYIHGEYVFNRLMLGVKPGLYSHNFKKTDKVTGNNPVEQSYKLRYLSIPVEVKYLFGYGDYKPFIGWEFSYGYLVNQGRNGNDAFKKSRFSTGPILGYYFQFYSFNLMFSSGYDFGFNTITRNEESTSGIPPFTPTKLKLGYVHFSLSILFNAERSAFMKSLDCPRIPKTN
jgi:hypothetical protein